MPLQQGKTAPLQYPQLESLCGGFADSRLAQLNQAVKALSPNSHTLPESSIATSPSPTDTSNPSDAMLKQTGHPERFDTDPAVGKVHAGRPQRDLQHDAPPVSPFQELQDTASSSLQDQHAPSLSALPAATAEQDATSIAATAGNNIRNFGQASGSSLHQGQQSEGSAAENLPRMTLPSQQAATNSKQDEAPSSPMSVRQGPVRSKRPSHAGSEPLASFSRVDTSE